MIMALVSMKILKIIHVNANQKIAVDLLFEKVLGGESRNGKKRNYKQLDNFNLKLS